jgi:hypothetical protein
MGDTLFGSAPETKFQQFPTLTPGQQSVLDALIPNVREALQGKGATPYSGEIVPGPSETQSQIFDLVGQLLRGTGPMQAEGTGVLTDIMGLMDPTKAQDYWEKGIKAPMMESWKKDIVPGILEQFAAYDAAGSGPARKAVSESGRRLETDMVSMLENLLQQFRGEAYGAAKTGLSYPETLISSTLPAAGQQYQISADQAMAAYKEWLRQQPEYSPWLQYLTPALGTRAFENVATTSGGQQGIFSDLIGAGATLGAAVLG